jgi:hypothetical protein
MNNYSPKAEPMSVRESDDAKKKRERMQNKGLATFDGE